MAKVSSEDCFAAARPPTIQLLESPSPLPPEKRAELLTTLREQLVPELLVAHWQDLRTPEPCAGSRAPPTATEVFEFARIACRQDLPDALAFVETMVRQGASLEVLLLHLIPPAARLLGDEWLADETSWAEVTVGLGTLQQVVHVFGLSFAPTPARRGPAVLVAAPGEQHTLGLYLLGEFLRRGGWDTLVEPTMPDAELVTLVESEYVELIGISVSSEDLLEAVGRLVGTLKRASRNPGLAVLLGGSIDLAEHAARLGASSFSDPRDVVRWLNGCSNKG